MLALREYRNRADRLSDHLPWAALVAPGVVLNKDGSLQRTLAFRGPDLESATEAELVSSCARANNVLRRFGSGWALFVEAERREALGYPDNRFPDAASWLVDEERRKVSRVAPNVPVSVLHVGTEDGAIRLSQINRRLARLKPSLTRAEVLAVSNRLESLTAGLPVPKGVDPTRLRPVRR